MSLLQEALKRKEQDEIPRQAQNPDAPAPVQAGPADAAPLSLKKPAGNTQPTAIKIDSAPAQAMPAQSMPATPPPENAVPSAAKRRSATALWIAIGTILILVVLAAVTGGMYILRHIPNFKTNVAVQALRRTGGVPAATGGPNAVAARSITPETQAVSGTSSPAGQMKSTDAAPGRTSEIPTQAVAPIVAQKADIPKPASLLKWPSPQNVSTKWPALKLAGILNSSATGESAAYINGRTVKSGQTVEGVTIVDIQPDRVTLKLGSETKTLRVGGIPY